MAGGAPKSLPPNLKIMSKIKFEIKDPGPIAIKVVDIIGKSITSFVNDYNIPGKYEVEFDDENLTPGRYYYKIFSRQEIAQSETSVNGFDKLLQSGTLKIGANGSGIK